MSKYLAIVVLCCTMAIKSIDCGMNNAMRKEILDAHNNLRAKVCNGLEPKQPKCANVVVMEWHDKLEQIAQGWANGCNVNHSKPLQNEFLPYNGTGVGENIALGMNNLTEAMNNFFRELDHYNFNNGECSQGKCGHYTQIMNFDSAYVGCGYKAGCKNDYGEHLVCNYAVAGNKGTHIRIYEAGEPASNCPPGYGFNWNGLCATKSQCQKAGSNCKCKLDGTCKNGGTFDSDKCYCKCSSEFDGSQCQKRCMNKKEYCGAHCPDTHPGIIDFFQDCKKSCGFCGKKFKPDDLQRTNVNNIQPSLIPISELKHLGKVKTAKEVDDHFKEWLKNLNIVSSTAASTKAPNSNTQTTKGADFQSEKELLEWINKYY